MVHVWTIQNWMQIWIADFINSHKRKLGQKFKDTVIVRKPEDNKGS